jgi:hypothetical protein
MPQEMKDEMEKFDQAIDQAGAEDEQMIMELAPVGDFSKSSVDRLVKAVNKMVPLFGGDPVVAPDGDLQQFPEDLTRYLAMILTATEAAVQADIIDPELLVSLDDLQDDRGITMLTARLEMLLKNREFKRFLQTPMEEEVVVEEVVEEEEASEELADDAMIDDLFEERI